MTQGVVGDAATRGIGKYRYEIMPGEGKGDCVGTHTRSDTPLTWMYVSFHYLCYHYYYYRRCLRTWEGATRGAPEREGKGMHTGGRGEHNTQIAQTCANSLYPYPSHFGRGILLHDPSHGQTIQRVARTTTDHWGAPERRYDDTLNQL